jgi:hypothetical protein
MPENNQKEKVRSVFNYKYFQLAAAVPLVLGFILMIFIWQYDNLSLEWPSKKTLETFLSYMSVPLWIMGSAIPLATLATANFRAIQFQENLEYQKRNLERQEFEHALDLYHKELNIFTACFNSVLLNEEYKIIKGSNATLIYSKAFSKPTPNSTTSKCINTIATLGKYFAAKLLTEAFIKRVCLATAKHLASKSENKLDDELVSALSEALK